MHFSLIKNVLPYRILNLHSWLSSVFVQEVEEGLSHSGSNRNVPFGSAMRRVVGAVLLFVLAGVMFAEAARTMLTTAAVHDPASQVHVPVAGTPQVHRDLPSR